MAVDAFVLPVPSGAVGVVLWGTAHGTVHRRAPGAGSAEEFAVYSPAPLSDGEVAALQAAYVGSLGLACGESRTNAALTWWWILGSAALLVLGTHTLGAGAGLAWLTAAVFVTALPRTHAGFVWPISGRAAGRARRLARRAAHLAPTADRNPRLQERVDGIWRTARRAAGAPDALLRELEGYCRDNAWPEAGQFYTGLRGAAAAPAARGVAASVLRRLRRRPAPPAAAIVEVRLP